MATPISSNFAEYRMWFTLSLFPDYYTLERRDSNQASITPDSSDMNHVERRPFFTRTMPGQGSFTLQHQQDKFGCRVVRHEQKQEARGKNSW